MFDSFVFIAPPLPDDLVARYFRHCLEDYLFILRRQVRMARMNGRFGADDETRLSLMHMILQSLLEDGIRDSLPLQRVDPEWSPETLDIAMHFYPVEARHIQYPGRNAPDLADHSGHQDAGPHRRRAYRTAARGLHRRPPRSLARRNRAD